MKYFIKINLTSYFILKINSNCLTFPTFTTCVFPILYWIRLIRWISWIKLEQVKHDWRVMKPALCLLLTVAFLVFWLWWLTDNQGVMSSSLTKVFLILFFFHLISWIRLKIGIGDICTKESLGSKTICFSAKLPAHPHIHIINALKTTYLH